MSDQSEQANVYQAVPDLKLGENTNGATSDGNYIQIKKF